MTQQLTDEQLRHLKSLKELTVAGGPIDTSAATATNVYYDPDDLARAKVRKRIIADFFAENTEVLRDRHAVIMAGPPGAGKSSALREKIPDGEMKYWRSIDPDDFKARLLRRAIASGEYDALVPDEVRRRQASGEVFAPGELAALAHEESSILAKQAREQALTRGERVIIDGVNGNGDKLVGRINELAGNGYARVDIICVDGPKDVTRARVLNRWAKGYAKYAADPTDVEAGFRARYVPEYVTDELYEDERFSTCATAVTQAAEDAPEGVTVDAAIYYVATPASAGQPWQSYHKDADGLTTTKHQVIDSPERVDVAPVAASDVAAGGDVNVTTYQRADGTTVQSHARNRPTRS